MRPLRGAALPADLARAVADVARMATLFGQRHGEMQREISAQRHIALSWKIGMDSFGGGGVDANRILEDSVGARGLRLLDVHTPRTLQPMSPTHAERPTRPASRDH